MRPISAAAIQDVPLSTTPADESLGYKVWEIQNHHHPQTGTKVYPEGVTPITVTSAATSDTFGSWTEVVPASTIDKKFDPDLIYVVDVSDAARVYILEIGAGDPGSEVVLGRVVVGAPSVNFDVKEFMIHVFPQLANTRIAARVKDDENATNDVRIFIGYHRYEPTGLQ